MASTRSHRGSKGDVSSRRRATSPGLFLFVFSLTVLFVAIATEAVAPPSAPMYKDVPFPQLNSTVFQFPNYRPVEAWYSLPSEFSDDIIQDMAYSSSEPDLALLLGSSSLWMFDLSSLSFTRLDEQANLPIQLGTRILTDGSGTIFVVAPNGVYQCYMYGCSFSSFALGTVNDIAFYVQSSDLIIGSDNGLFFFSSSSSTFTQVEEIKEAVNAVGFVPPTDVVAGTDTVLWRWLGGKDWYYFQVPGIIDGPISTLAVDQENSLWIGNDVCINIQYANLTFERIGYEEGLVYSNISSIAMCSNSGAVWVGSSLLGAFRLETVSQRGDWKYFFGPRWFPTTSVDVSETSGSSVSKAVCVPTTGNITEVAIVATKGGISLLYYNLITLADKANILGDIMYPRHDRYGLVGGCNLQSFGNLSSWTPTTDDNNGLWSGIYLASQCFRYAVTGDPVAKQNAWTTFEAMEFLNNVTGIKGYMARSFAKPNDGSGAGGQNWYNSTAYPGWIWKGDTSSDEVTGHLFAYPIFYDLVAETPEEKQRAYNLIYNIVYGIVEHNFTLINQFGNATTWGKWNPQYLNDDPDWYDDRGLNSMQILSWLLTAYRISNDTYFTDAYNLLTQKYHYDVNIVDLKITQPSDDNFSDDELTFLAYFSYIWNQNYSLGSLFDDSLSRTFAIAKPERPSPYNYIYAAYYGPNSNYDLAGSVVTLQQYPLSWINWPYLNSPRLDITINRDMSRQGTPISLYPLPYDEVFVSRWNGAPFQLDQDGGGDGETDTGAWLLPYWMARYYNLISGPQY
eukprot:TRINITY_DN7060_c0_g4_i2.p1 TRINITY_DN7060_c0_g4~~TRINITY_DN7060_c0_g4_i2.p1  ORF type:complete len:802 (-),score=153.57 TRINITY_DN7060_c0_g4_i2:157-2529(-)